MDSFSDPATLSVRVDTSGFARDVAEMRGALEGVLGEGATRTGRIIETSLLRAVRTGKLGFEDLKASALSALAAIAASALRDGLAALFGGGSGGGGLGSIIGGLLKGLPGRATGGPVAPGRAYMVGERGPELFVPTASGSIAALGGAGPREVRVAISINAPAETAPAMLAKSSRQVARAVRAALMED